MRKVLLSILTMVLLIASFFGVKLIADTKTGPNTEVKKVIKIVTTAAVINTSIYIVLAENPSRQAKNVSANTANLERSQEWFKLAQPYNIDLGQAQVNLFNAEKLKNLSKYDAKLAEYQLLLLAGQLLNIPL
jgi:hypothetical protein